MSQQKDSTTLVCLFHRQDHAQAAVSDLHQAGIAQSSISIIGGPNAPADALDKSKLASLGMPDRDYNHLRDGVRDGGVVVAVADVTDTSDAVEDIFGKHSARQIDEAESSNREVAATAAAIPLATAVPVAADAVTEQTAIPVIEEELVVGKRAVDQGGVRVYRHVVEIPVEESVSLREEHVVIERRPVNRAVSDTDGAFENKTIEMTETAEEAVIAKNARVVEEVLIGRTASQHVETIHDTVRKTEVDIEELPGSRKSDSTSRS